MKACKNCQNELSDIAFYCHRCGAKVIRNRLTPGNLITYTIEAWFNIDNSFLQTLVTLFTDPKEVIHGYITGLRKKYMNPISYMTIAITLSGLVVLLMQKYVGEFEFDMMNQNLNQERFQEFNRKVMDFTYDFHALLFLLYVPVFALAGWLTFNKVGYNLTEYFVVIIYNQAQYSIVSFPITLMILFTDAENYLSWALAFSVFMVGLIIYSIQMLNRFSWGAFLLRMIVFMLRVMVGFVGIVIFQYILLFATGTITVEDFLNLNQATSSAMNWASYNLV